MATTIFEDLMNLYRLPSPNLRRPDWADANDLQDAVNPSAIIRTWAAVQEKIWKDAQHFKQGTDFVRFHPINVLYASKLSVMTNEQNNFPEAYQLVLQQIKELT